MYSLLDKYSRLIDIVLIAISPQFVYLTNLLILYNRLVDIDV